MVHQIFHQKGLKILENRLLLASYHLKLTKKRKKVQKKRLSTPLHNLRIKRTLILEKVTTNRDETTTTTTIAVISSTTSADGDTTLEEIEELE